MKLNPDCIRAVLLEIEKSWKIEELDDGNLYMDGIMLQTICDALPKFEKADIFYSLYNLDQAGYVDLNVQWADGGIPYYCMINHMPYAGHEFLNQIRDNNHWGLIKKGLGAVGNYSLNAISAVAEGVANAAISAFLKEAGLTS